jgi:hypothetical protein
MLDTIGVPFISEIYEARMTRNSADQRILTYTDCSERLYLTVLILELLSKYKTYKHFAKSYAKSTTTYSSYKNFRMNGTDLYNFIYFVTGDQKAMDKLKDPKSAMAKRKATTLPTMALNRYLSKIASGLTSTETQLFANLESALKIRNSDYKTIRRDILNYTGLTERNRKKAVTRLLHAARAKLRNSDIIQHLQKLVADKNLETGLVKDNEPKISVPDIGIQGRDLAMYRYLTGTKSIVQLKRFIEFALAGKSIPATIVSAYIPAIKMIDDIVKAGPGSVAILKGLHQRVLKTPRK